MVGSDFRYAWRALTHQRLGSALVVAMLALGVGANVAVFSLINGLFLRPLPFPDPDRLVYLNETAPRWNLVMATAMLALIPPVLVVLAMQRLFVKGLVESEK